MSLYVIEYTYDHTLDSLIQTYRPAHREFLRRLHASGRLIASGFLRDGSSNDALIILAASSKAKVEDLLRDDPFELNGFILSKRIREWVPTIGMAAEGFDTEFPIS